MRPPAGGLIIGAAAPFCLYFQPFFPFFLQVFHGFPAVSPPFFHLVFRIFPQVFPHFFHRIHRICLQPVRILLFVITKNYSTLATAASRVPQAGPGPGPDRRALVVGPYREGAWCGGLRACTAWIDIN